MNGLRYRKWPWNDFLFIMNIRSISGLDFEHLGSACFFSNSFDMNPLVRNWISNPFESSDLGGKIIKFIFLLHWSAWTVNSKKWTKSVVTFWLLDFPFLCNSFSFQRFHIDHINVDNPIWSDAAVPTNNQMIQSNLETVPEITFLSIGLSRPKNEFIFKRIYDPVNSSYFFQALLAPSQLWNLK